VDRPLPTGPGKRCPSPAVEMIRRLGPTTPTLEPAERLNDAGLTTGRGRQSDDAAGHWIRHAYNVPAPAPDGDGELSDAEAARRLGCSTGVVCNCLNTGQFDARPGSGNLLCIPWSDHVQATCHHRITEPGHLNPTARRNTHRARR
jgi:hypothetical protein